MSEHENDIRDLLDSAAQQPALGPTERTRSVVARGRAARRRNRVALAAVAAVAVVGIAVPVLTGGDDGARGVDVAGGPTSVEPEPCPDPPVDVETLAPTDLPSGAAWARMCDGTWSGADGDPSTASITAFDSTAVTEDVDALLAAIRGLPRYDQVEPECATMMMAPTPWTFVVGYADGTTATIGSTVIACGAAEVAGAPRSSAVILELVGDAVNDADDAETTEGVAECPEPVNGLRTLEPEADTYDGDLTTFRQTAAVVCYGIDPLGGPEYAATEGELDDEQRFSIFTEAASGSTPDPRRPGGCIDSGPTRLIVLVDDQAKRLTLTDNSCTGEFTWKYGFWKPGPEAEQLIADALGGRVNQR